MIQLDYLQLNFRLKALQPGQLPPYKGSLLRGVFGHALKKLCCTHDGKCQACPLIENCSYAYIFETHQSTLKNNLPRAYCPHPFLIDAYTTTKTNYSPGDELEFTLTLFGHKSITLVELFIKAFDLATKKGLGINNIPFELSSVELIGEKDPTIWSKEHGIIQNIPFQNLNPFFNHSQNQAQDLLLINFITPTKLIEKNRNVQTITFHILMKAILRRLDMLTKAHGVVDLDIDYKKLLAAAEEVKIEMAQLKGDQMVRYSNRQKSRVELNGLTGKVLYKGDDFTEFMPYLKVAEIIHIGKGTVMGLGKFRLHPSIIHLESS